MFVYEFPFSRFKVGKVAWEIIDLKEKIHLGFKSKLDCIS